MVVLVLVVGNGQGRWTGTEDGDESCGGCGWCASHIKPRPHHKLGGPSNRPTRQSQA